MKIDFGTGKVYYPDSNEELKESLEELKLIEDCVGIETGTKEEAVFSKDKT